MPDLFTLITDRVHVSWAGPSVPSDSEMLVVEPLGGPVHVAAGPHEERAHRQLAVPLRLEEETSYPVLVRSRNGAAVALHHRDPVLVGGLVAAEGGRVLHGAVRFGGFVGTSR